MRYLLLSFILLAGCAPNHKVPASVVAEALDACSINDGLHTLNAYVRRTDAICNNGAVFTIKHRRSLD